MRYIEILLIFIITSLANAASHQSYCIAHRGNNISYIENTFSSFKSAYEIGSDGIELDNLLKRVKPSVLRNAEDLMRMEYIMKNVD